jgi:hypothetical protein
MKIIELVEAIGTVGSSTDIVGSGTLPNTGSSTQPKSPISPEQMTQVRTNLNNIKGLLSNAGGGNIDVGKIVQILGKDNDPSKPLDPQLVRSLQGVIPGFSDAMQDQLSGKIVQHGIQTGLDAKQKATQQQDQQAKLQTASNLKTGQPAT